MYVYRPLIAGQVIVDAGFHVLESIKSGKHVDEFGQREEVRLRDEVLSLLRVSQLADLITESRRGTEYKSHHLFGFVDLWTENGDCFLVDLHTIGLLLVLDLGRGREEECVCGGGEGGGEGGEEGEGERES